MTRLSRGILSYFIQLERSTEAGIPFTELARKYESEFFEDMKTLGCRTANVITRVSEVCNSSFLSHSST